MRTELDLAIERLFNTTELLEAILLRLPFKEILKSQLVAKRWKETIQISISLQKAMHIAADGDVVRPSFPYHCGDPRLYNPFREYPFLETSSFEVLPLFELDQDSAGHQKPVQDSWRYFRTAQFGLPYVIHSFTTNIENDGTLRIPSAYRPMLFTQPPVSAVGLSTSGAYRTQRLAVYSKKGVTLHHIEEVIQAMIKQARYFPTRALDRQNRALIVLLTPK